MFSAPSSSAESVGVTVWSSSVRTVIHRGPAGVSSPAFSRRTQVAAGDQLLARRRAAPAHVRRRLAATSVPWCGEPSVSTRRTTAVAAVVAHEEPRDHPAGRVADHVDRAGAGAVASCARPGRRAASPAPAGRPCRPSVGWKTIAVRPSRRSSSTSGASVARPIRRTPGTTITGPGLRLVDGTATGRRPRATTSASTPATRTMHQRADDHHQSPTRARERAQLQPGVSSVGTRVSAQAVGRPRCLHVLGHHDRPQPGPEHEEHRRRRSCAMPPTRLMLKPSALVELVVTGEEAGDQQDDAVDAHQGTDDERGCRTGPRRVGRSGPRWCSQPCRAPYQKMMLRTMTMTPATAGQLVRLLPPGQDSLVRRRGSRCLGVTE